MNTLENGLEQIANTITRHVPHAKLDMFNESIALTMPDSERSVDISWSTHEPAIGKGWKVFMADEHDINVEATPYPGDAAAKAIQFLIHGRATTIEITV